MPFRLATTTDARLFGLSPVWRGTSKVMVSDPSRTVVDVLDTPALGGGVRHVFDILREYFEGEKRDDKTLMGYILRLDNKAVCKRLGYMLDLCGIAAPELHAFCRKNMSAGYSKLDPGVGKRGRLLRKWRLVVNVALQSGVGMS